MHISHRGHFKDLIEENDYNIIVEIGVRYGGFAFQLASASTVKKFYAIDPYNYNAENQDPNNSYESAKKLLLPLGNVEIIRAKNEDVVGNFEDKSIDFVYIDGLHDYNSVKLDMNNWWPKIKDGGCMAGHDFHPVFWPGIVEAVLEFVYEHHMRLFITGVGDLVGETDANMASWYFLKEGV